MMAEQNVIVGVDTHKHIHVAVALSRAGERLGDLTVSVDPGGYAQLLAWAQQFGAVWCFGVESCGSYGQGLVGFLRRHDQRVVEAGRPDRRDRRERGKSDPIDAENAARAVLAGTATGVPKSANGTSEVIREIKIARDTAVKSRTQAVITLKTLIVTAPDELRQELQPLTKAKLRDRCAALRPGKVDTPLAAAKHAIRSLARRWQHLEAEIKEHDRLLDSLTAQAAPALREAFGIGVDVAAEMIILAGDKPRAHQIRGRVREALRRLSDPSFIWRYPASQVELGRPQTSQQRSLPLRDRQDALSPADDRLRRQAHPGRQDQARDHPLPQAIPRSRDLPHHRAVATHDHTAANHQKTRPRPLLTTIGASTLSPRASSRRSRRSSSTANHGRADATSAPPSSSTSRRSTTDRDDTQRSDTSPQRNTRTRQSQRQRRPSD